MTITTFGYCGTGLSFDGTTVDGTGVHGVAMLAAARPQGVVRDAAAAADPATTKTQGIRPRRPEPA
ncbi:MAG TPA: hypothetical protein VF288_12875 [Mycobacteriales bacterium]